MADIRLNIKDSNGNAIVGTDVTFNLGNLGTITRTTDSDGKVQVLGLYSGTYTYKVEDVSGTFEISDETKSYVKDVIARTVETVNNVGNTTIENIKSTTDVAIKGLVDAFIFKDTDNYTEIKNQYNSLHDNIKQQKSILENALKTNAYDLISAQGQNFTASIVKGIQPLMDKLVSKRSEINPFSSFKNFGLWAKYTSMIAGVYTLRQAIVTFLNELTEKAKNQASSTINNITNK